MSAPHILDLCGSWISHLPKPLPLGTKVFGIGLNEEELERNEGYDEWKVYDLNETEKQDWRWLPDESVDLVICTVSIDYLVYPVSVLQECRRVLKDRNSPVLFALPPLHFCGDINSGGSIHLAISNRCFPTKVIAKWLRLSESGRLEMVSNFVHFAGFKEIEMVDVVKGGVVGRWEGDWGVNDPIWIVRGRKL
jgi:ubiquinone/menaquinone biosynthesis C-methylase UbiE